MKFPRNISPPIFPRAQRFKALPCARRQRGKRSHPWLLLNEENLMNDFASMIALIAGCLLGGLAVWFLLRERIRTIAAQARTESELELAVLNERLADRDQEITELRAESEVKDKKLRSSIPNFAAKRPRWPQLRKKPDEFLSLKINSQTGTNESIVCRIKSPN